MIIGLFQSVENFRRDSALLRTEARALIEDDPNALYFSSASVWEVAIKNALGKPGFRADPHLFRRAQLDNGYAAHQQPAHGRRGKPA
ncbi:hypothetical protein [Candidatus Accumulibacter aalborgensis]|nr:hypothetical protein [Candidatus Accumulibacter aalborgensis]